ncbi:YigZ family protein [Sulfurimonas sp. SAG-AH-194-C20]|nr:YigZ family protein [Sulfurimonas sp. SAG-AH-194-C20]MDF1878699.1 YigZ family protein [Sulfurimonas sp. SAG-AH-194-C20]
MKYVKDISTHTLEVKQSKFIAWLAPYDDYKTTLQKLKNKHPKARHFVTAYRYLNEYGQIVEHSSDDGEPNGTSGKPSLMVLQGNSLINTAVIIVRYFGGTKLGTGGLVRAYSDAVNLVVGVSDLEKYSNESLKIIEIKYSDIRFIEYGCEIFNIVILEKIFDIKSTYKIKADEENMEKFLEKVKRVVTLLKE